MKYTSGVTENFVIGQCFRAMEDIPVIPNVNHIGNSRNKAVEWKPESINNRNPTLLVNKNDIVSYRGRISLWGEEFLIYTKNGNKNDSFYVSVNLQSKLKRVPFGTTRRSRRT